VRIGVIHGPNLNLLGSRQPEIYGRATLTEIDGLLGKQATELGAELETIQSNSEGELIDFIQGAGARVDGFLVNAAGLTHTSVSLLDALLAVDRPFVEVHLSNPAARDRFRRRSLLAPWARGVVQGFGAESYLLGLRGLIRIVCDGAHEHAAPERR
jgi:3-dehydroquinate dehydratase-2